MRKTKKAVISLMLVGVIAQCLAGCSTNPSEADKEEARQEITKVQEEIQSEIKEIQPVMTEPAKESQDEGDQFGDYQAKAEELSTFILENPEIFGGVTTIQYALMDGDEIVLSNMIGVNEEWNKPVFCIASSSKVYVTASVMILVDRGEIDLDTPIVQYIPEFTMADERYKEITPRMLLNHSSGFYGTTASYGNSMSLGAPSTVGKERFLEYKKDEVLKADPGEFSVYANDGFIMAEILIEKVSGMSYTEFIKENISGPLGLTYTTTAHDLELNTADITPGIAPPDGEPLVEYMNYPGTGGIYSTTEEMCKFAGLFAGAHPEILSEESAELTLEHEFAKGIWVEENADNAVGYGLGWDDVTAGSFAEYGIRAANKGGDASFHHADITVLPDHNISMAVLTSGGSSLFNGIVSEAVLLEYLYSKGIIDTIHEGGFEPAAPVKVDMPEELQNYDGLYGTGGSFGRVVQITIEDGSFTIPEGLGGLIPETTFVYTGDGEFTREDGAAFVYFKEETNGEIYLVQREYRVIPGFGEVVIEGQEFQKLEAQQISESVKSAWQAREGKQYFLVNEMYNSSNYLETLMLVFSPDMNLETGYVSGDKIIDEMKAVNVVKIPVMGGRDNYDINFFTNNGKEYMNKNNQFFIAEEHLVPFDPAEGRVVLGTEGYSEWFVIDENTAGKEINISISENSSVFIYDGNLTLFACSMDPGEQTFTLPSGGFIVFAGAAGTEFNLA